MSLTPVIAMTMAKEGTNAKCGAIGRINHNKRNSKFYVSDITNDKKGSKTYNCEPSLQNWSQTWQPAKTNEDCGKVEGRGVCHTEASNQV